MDEQSGSIRASLNSKLSVKSGHHKTQQDSSSGAHESANFGPVYQEIVEIFLFGGLTY